MNEINKNIQAVLFDLDGVIVDTAKYHYKAWKYIADNEGIYFDSKINERLKGVSRMESLLIILEKSQKKYTQEDCDLLVEQKNTYYKKLLEKLTPDAILPRINDFIKDIKQQGIKTSICSVSKNTNTILDKLEIKELFDTIVCGLDITNSKPDPEVFVKAAERLNVNPINCLVIEDSAAGIEGAIKGNMKSIGIGTKENLGKANKVISSTNELSLNILNDII